MKVEKDYVENIFGTAFSRKSFLKMLGFGLIFFLSSGKYGKKQLLAADKKLEPRKKKNIKVDCDLAVAKGKNPAAITRKAVETLGGMKRFVKTGDIVVVKPNIGWDRSPEQAATTNPEVVAELVKMSFECGAKTVKVFDNTCNDPRRCYDNSGIQRAAKAVGAEVIFLSDWKYYPAVMPAGNMMADWPMFEDAVKCDCFINVPIAKHHRLARLTLSMKNLMGICGGMRGKMHSDIDTKLAEVTSFIRPDLTVIDANRILLDHGPSGGDLADVKEKNIVIAGIDPVLCDAYAATLFDLKPENIGHIKKAAEMGVGSMNIASARIKSVNV
jgi:uncharacterized protein (DUF362 family)